MRATMKLGSRATIALASLASSCCLLVPETARADEEERVPPGVFAAALGFATAAVPFGVGSFMATSAADRDVRNAGILVAQGGFVLAPITAHAAAGEWGRGAIFAMPPLAAEGTMVGVMLSYPDVLRKSPVGIQYLYAGSLSLSVLSGAVGVIDTTFAEGRARRVRVTPLFDRSAAGAMIGGTL
jgi:hypothetical protein